MARAIIYGPRGAVLSESRIVRGRVYTETLHDDFRLLGDLGASKAQVVGTGGSAGAGIATAAIGGAAGGPVGLAIGLVSGIIASIFGAHAAKVKREDEVTGVWAQTGQRAISEVMAVWRSGKASKADTIQGLHSIEAYFKSLTADVVKTGGKFGVFPNPDAPRPSKNCNAACGLYYELHQQIKGLVAEVQSGKGGGGIAGLGASLGGLFSGGNMPLIAVALVLFFVMKR